MSAVELYLGTFLQGVLLATVLTGVALFLARARGWAPAIRARDVHTTRTPRVGGIGMWVTVAVLLAAGASSVNSLAAGVTKSIALGIAGGLIVILIFGLLDDTYGLKPIWQFVGQGVAAMSVLMGGLALTTLRLPIVGEVAVSPVLSGVIIAAWIVVMINAINLFDGLDGLAGSIGLTGSFFLFLVSYKLGFAGSAMLCMVLLSAIAGFLPWNWYPAKVFMGTVGSQLIGYLLAVAAVLSGAKVATAVLVLGIPLFDAFSVIIRRLRAHQSPFKADQRHLHHRLLRIGLKPPAVVLITNAFAILFGLAALGTQRANEKALLMVLLIITMFLLIAVTYFLERRAARAVQ